MDIVSIRKIILTVHGVVLIIFYFINATLPVQENHFLLLPICVWNIIIFLILLYNELTKSRDFHPFMILLIAAIQYVGFNGISLYYDVAVGDRVEFGIYDITDYLTKGVLFLSFEHLLLYWGFSIVQKKHETDSEETIVQSVMERNIDYRKWAIRFYLFVWALRIIGYAVNLQAISSLLYNITTQGQMVSMMLLLFAYLKNGKNKNMQLHWVIVGIEFVMALSSGMKEVMLQNLIPYVLYLFVEYKSGMRSFNFSFLMKLSLIGAFVIYFAFPYVSLYREMAWKPGATATVSDVMDEYVDYISGSSKFADQKGERDVDYMLSRTGSLGSNTWSIMYADKYGNEPVYMLYAASALIPRVIWPDKPPIRLGVMIHSLAMGFRDWTNIEIHSGVSYTSGFIGSCYFSLGLWFAILMPFLMGYIVTRFWYFFKKRMSVNIVAIIAVFSIIATTYKDFEDYTDGGIVSCVFSLVYCLIIKYMENHGYATKI